MLKQPQSHHFKTFLFLVGGWREISTCLLKVKDIEQEVEEEEGEEEA